MIPGPTRVISTTSCSQSQQAGPRRGRGRRRVRRGRPGVARRHRRRRLGRRVLALDRSRCRPRDPRGAAGGRDRPVIPCSSTTSSRSSRVSTFPASAVCASRTPSSSAPPVPSRSPSPPRISCCEHLHQRPEERHGARPARGSRDRRRVPAREAGQGRRVRAHQAEERAHRRGDRPHVPRRREGQARDHRQARDAVPLPRGRRLRLHGQRDATTSSTCRPRASATRSTT